MGLSRSPRPQAELAPEEKGSKAAKTPARADNSLLQSTLADQKKAGALQQEDMAWFDPRTAEADREWERAAPLDPEQLDFIRSAIDPDLVYDDAAWAYAKTDLSVFNAKVDYINSLAGADPPYDYDLKSLADDPQWSEKLASIRADIDPEYVYDDAEWARAAKDAELFNLKVKYVAQETGSERGTANSGGYACQFLGETEFWADRLAYIRANIDPDAVYSSEEWARADNDSGVWDAKLSYVDQVRDGL